MSLSQKCQYALRAVFELARRSGKAPLSVPEIARSQAIPRTFLVIILVELRRQEIVKSRRGRNGGYWLAVAPDKLTIGRVIRLVDGPLDPVKCIGRRGEEHCSLRGRCAFVDLWDRANQAVADVYDATTFQDLVDGRAAKPPKPPKPKRKPKRTPKRAPASKPPAGRR